MINTKIYESSQRNTDINLIPFKNNDKKQKENYTRNMENKSVILITKNPAKFNDDRNSNTDRDFKINVKTNSENIIIQKQKRPSSSNINNSINRKLDSKFNILQLFEIKSRIKTKNDSIYNFEINERCLVCDDELNEKEKENNFIECHHALCSECYYNYLKENIETNNVINIKCPINECEKILYNNFIEKMLINDIPLLDKYKKFVNRRQLILNPDIQLCPFPDCESYAKKGKNKYVACIHNNHKFCLKCLKEWHGNKSCKYSNVLDDKFEHWRNPNKVKKCPKCKYFIEKNDGCNHITCFNCQYEFCWLCLDKYNENHYKTGICSGLQYSSFEYLSNKICLYLRRFIIVILKTIGFFFFFPFVFSILSHIKIYEAVFKTEDNIMILWSISGMFSCFSFLAPLFCVSAIISILMIFIWPLQDKIYDLICF